MTVRMLLGALAACLALAPFSGVRAETRALLVGVGQYHSPQIPSLAGPANDLRALKGLLADEGVRDIITLTEGQATRSSPQGAGGPGDAHAAR
jgi:hypothetical protein